LWKIDVSQYSMVISSFCGILMGIIFYRATSMISLAASLKFAASA